MFSFLRTARGGLVVWLVVLGLPVWVSWFAGQKERVGGGQRAFLRGVSLGLFATRKDYDYGRLLDEIEAHGATDVLLAFPWFQRDVHASGFERDGTKKPSAAALRRTIQQARRLGLRVSLMPIIQLSRRRASEWRGRLQPRQLQRWFASYERRLVRLARAAQAHGVVRMAVGSELNSMMAYPRRWRRLIQKVREVFHGRLFYSANWDAFAQVPFWDALDEVGISAYFSLARQGERPSEAALRRRWDKPLAMLRRWQERVQKPLFFSEVGYPARRSAAWLPWDETKASPIDLELQARLYKAFCEALPPRQLLHGFFIWNWFGFGGPRDPGYSPRGKPAAQVLRRCLQDPRWHAPRSAGNKPPSAS